MNIFDQEILARTALGEARGEGEEAMQAVMWTVVNRYTKKRWFSGQSIAGTALMKMQYSCWMQSDPNYALITNIGAGVPLYDMAMLDASAVISGMCVDPTLGATHYYADSIAAPAWVTGATMTINIGRQTFYKDVS